MATSGNPRYNYALGAINQSGAPPFDLSGVVMRVFPLRANYHALQLFCDRFVNIAPEISHFEPAAPYVLFCVINYGHMGNVASNLGYTAQNEVLFAPMVRHFGRQAVTVKLSREDHAGVFSELGVTETPALVVLKPEFQKRPGAEVVPTERQRRSPKR